MKYLSVLVVLSVMFFASSAQAQQPSKSNSKTYTYVMKNIDGSGEEIIDKLTFTESGINSEKLSASGYKSGQVVQKNATANSSQFEVTLQSPAKGTMKYQGLLSDGLIDGTILVTDEKGVQTTMAIRGMLTEKWDEIQRQKQNYQKNQN